jgi:hypothetical protein
MSVKKKDKVDLIEDITVEELLADGLIENVEVSVEEPSKKADEAEVKTDTDNTPEKAVASVDAAANAGPKAEEPTPIKTQIEDAPADPVKAPQAAIDAAIAAAPEAEEPKTKAGLINAMYQHMSKMTTEQLAAMHSELTEEKDEEEKFDFAKKDDDDSEDDSKEDDEKKDDDSEDDEEDEDDEEVKEGIDSLVAAEKSLSEEFRSKASKLFESTVKARVADQVSTIQENYNTRLAEEVETIHTSLTEKVDSYLSYVAKEWMDKNKVAVEKGLRTEIAEGFIEGLKNLFKENYIEVPEGKENLIDTLNKDIAKLEEQLNAQTEANMKLAESVNVLTRKRILAETSVDLAATEAAKLASLTESVVFESAESFTQKVVGIKETYFRKTVTPSQINEVETAINENGHEVELSPLMEVYSTALSRTLKK